jgi:hypothetical protein
MHAAHVALQDRSQTGAPCMLHMSHCGIAATEAPRCGPLDDVMVAVCGSCLLVDRSQVRSASTLLVKQFIPATLDPAG